MIRDLASIIKEIDFILAEQSEVYLDPCKQGKIRCRIKPKKEASTDQFYKELCSRNIKAVA